MREHGSIEGVLTGRCHLVDRHTEAETICHWLGDTGATAAESIGKRVELTGWISGGLIMVESIRVLRPRSELPQFDDLAGIDITGGMESAAYVRRLRDD